MASTKFLNVVAVQDKAASLKSLCCDPGGDGEKVTHIELDEFRAIPGSPFAYWTTDHIRRLFSERPLESDTGRIARRGLPTHDDSRWLRLIWEVPPGGGLAPLAKGGEYRKYYTDLHQGVRWNDGGRELRVSKLERLRLGELTANNSKLWSESHYGRPGLFWPRRATGLCFRPLPSEAIFGDNGPSVFVERDDRQELATLLALLNSSVFELLVNLQAGRVALAKSYEVGQVRCAPVPDLDSEQSSRLAELGLSAWSITRRIVASDETSHAFRIPRVLEARQEFFDASVVAAMELEAQLENDLAAIDSSLNAIACEVYGVDPGDVALMIEAFGSNDEEVDTSMNRDEFDAEAASGVHEPQALANNQLVHAEQLLSWAVGAALGRFDLRPAVGAAEWPSDPNPFDPLPESAPGILAESGASHISLLDDYPVSASPVLVIDPGHEFDLVTRVRKVFDAVFANEADTWWSDVEGALGRKYGIDGWLRRNFFDRHLTLYSQSRRKAPIIWPIATRSGVYQVWVYAHRITADSLFQLLTDVIEPKLASEQRQLSDLAQEFGPSPSASQRRALDAQHSLVDELIELHDEMRTVAPLWHPDFNDGIAVVLAPLWRLFANDRAWSKELETQWTNLASGEYDWAQLAMHIWPERVIPKCAEDRSLAIAHDLEDVFWAQDDTNPDEWHPRRTPTTPIDQLIADRTNPTITVARTHPNP